MARDYLYKSGSHEISSYHRSTVELWETDWQKQRENLVHLQEALTQIQRKAEAINYPESPLEPDQLREHLEEFLRLLQIYENIAETGGLRGYCLLQATMPSMLDFSTSLAVASAPLVITANFSEPTSCCRGADDSA